MPRDPLNAIETKQAELRAQPEITVGCLRNCLDAAFEKALPDRPRRVRVLIDIDRRVESESTGFAPQENAQGDSDSSRAVRSLHVGTIMLLRRKAGNLTWFDSPTGFRSNNCACGATGVKIFSLIDSARLRTGK